MPPVAPSIELPTANPLATPSMRAHIVAPRARDLRLFVIAGEHSGDALGAKLMAAINAERRGHIRYLGVGAEHMAAQGLISQFALAEVAVMGPAAILRRLPRLARRVWQTADAVVAAEPDALVIIDAPEFTHQIARRVRRRRPAIPIIDYVSPSVWAWRPGRAARMRHYVDHVMALLPFEPEAHARLGGPACTYVGHPLIERAVWLQALDPAPLATALALPAGRPVLVVLPGSRPSEVVRLLAPFGAAVARLAEQGRDFEVILPVAPAVRAMVEAGVAGWTRRPHLVEGEEAKFHAFKLARAALAASGTVTLELALAGTPMVVAYKVDGIAKLLRPLVKTPHFALANLVLGERAFPELMQEACEPERLADALGLLLDDGAVREAQLAALARIPGKLALDGLAPSEAAAAIVLHYADKGR